MANKTKKAPKKQAKKSSASAPKSNVSKEVKKQNRFLHDVEFNLHVIIYLFGINLILICVVLFYVTQLQVLTQVESDSKDILPYDDFSYYEYNMAQFSNFAKTDITSARDLEKYAFEQEFDTVYRKDGFFHGEKEGTCFNDLTRQENRCRKAIIEYDESNPTLFQVFLVREYQYELEE